MGDVVDFLKAFDAYFLIGLSVASLLLLAYCVTLSRRLAAAGRRQSAKLSEGNVEHIVDRLAEHSEALASLGTRLDRFSDRLQDHSESLASCIRKVGVVRFNAFDDVGGEQSFALVLLDARGNGVAVSSLYGRQESRLYAKAISGGEPERTLSDEERQALDKALA